MTPVKSKTSINEWELECTLMSRFPQLLPDLYSAGYAISRQVLLAGRRLDIVLEKDDHAWIIELKKGSPDVEATTRQILDYHACWRAAYPDKATSLLVIANSQSDAKREAFERNNIAYRAVSPTAVLAALEEGIDISLLGKCNRLKGADDVGRIRFLLSNFALVTVPEAMKYEPWCHASVYYALIRDGMKHTDPWKKRISVHLFPQKPKCAILYHPEADVTHGDAFLHLNPRASSWTQEASRLVELSAQGVIVHRGHDRDGTGRSDFDSYAVNDWGKLAKVLSLKGDPSD